ncbi:hypothetical protein NCCP2222_17900 [Sporosarcina sp. NCCP-2222]|uniref:YusW family protein n=1 Tax=Sporosarcina sp. NCCP-2222 TaxID=2935073 RepID=UPI00207F046C|nr:YusW family protein [Sporosarcina sp. NCCP-2222]GKV55843.1 hypothetical protein NCCP2222_17900 [Sporosarcina sp. NCCP-2222]
MKIHKLISVLLLFVFVLSACSDRTIVTDRKESKETVGDTYGFTSFNLTIETKMEKQAVTVMYEEKPKRTEAEYSNKEKGISTFGNKAMKKLDELFKSMKLTPDMPEEDMIKTVSETFEISDYKMIKLSVKFVGHDAKEIRISK